jgi:hypothetical protein
MKKNIIYIFLFALISSSSFAQDEPVAKEKDYPVDAVFESGYLIDAQTTVIPEVKTLEMAIQHKFAPIEDGISNLWGIYGSANIRLGMNYVVAKHFQIGAGVTKKYMMTDVNAKWSILQQTRKNTMPISLALYGVLGSDGRDVSAFESGMVQESSGDMPIHYRYIDRVNYFSQLIVSRKFCKEFSMQAALSYTHYNAVGTDYDHDKIGVHVNGRIKVTPMGSIIFNYDTPLKISGISEQSDWSHASKASMAVGYEVSTGTHAFQMFLSSTNSLLQQDNMMWNQNKMDASGFAFGFVITRLWGF